MLVPVYCGIIHKSQVNKGIIHQHMNGWAIMVYLHNGVLFSQENDGFIHNLLNKISQTDGYHLFYAVVEPRSYVHTYTHISLQMFIYGTYKQSGQFGE